MPETKADRHKQPPISFRPPKADRARLLQHVAETGQKVNAVLAKALAEYLDRLGDDRDG